MDQEHLQYKITNTKVGNAYHTLGREEDTSHSYGRRYFVSSYPYWSTLLGLSLICKLGNLRVTSLTCSIAREAHFTFSQLSLRSVRRRETILLRWELHPLRLGGSVQRLSWSMGNLIPKVKIPRKLQTWTPLLLVLGSDFFSFSCISSRAGYGISVL